MTTSAYVFCHPTCPCRRDIRLLCAPYLVSEAERHGVDLLHFAIRRWNLFAVGRAHPQADFELPWGAAIMRWPVGAAIMRGPVSSVPDREAIDMDTIDPGLAAAP